MTSQYADEIEPVIVTLRGHKVMLDADLARIYGVPTRVLNQAVKRNREKFPADFIFQLTPQEVAHLKSQIVTSSSGGIQSQMATGSAHGGRRKLPYAFTEHGTIMAVTILNSPRAVQMSVFVVRAFVRMRAALSDTRELARKLAGLEKELKDRLDVHESAIVDVLRQIMLLLGPPPEPEPSPKQVGFHARERAAKYAIKRSRRSKATHSL